MQRVEKCEVSARKKNLYYIKLVKNAECDGCKACAFGRKNYLIMPALSLINCAVGDRVSVIMPSSRVKGSYLYLYLLPLLFIFIGILIPINFGEIPMLIGGAAGLTVSIPVVYFIELMFRKSKKYLPIISEKISDTKETNNDRF